MMNSIPINLPATVTTVTPAIDPTTAPTIASGPIVETPSVSKCRKTFKILQP